MSWTTYYQDVDRNGIGQLEPQNDGAKQSDGQFEAARTAAAELIDSRTLGDPEKHRYHVSLSGHANPGHGPTEGMGPDSITVSVSQA